MILTCWEILLPGAFENGTHKIALPFLRLPCNLETQRKRRLPLGDLLANDVVVAKAILPTPSPDYAKAGRGHGI
jgi:hypothetical protein